MFTVLISTSSFFIYWYDFGLVDKEYVFRCDFDSQNLEGGEETKREEPISKERLLLRAEIRNTGDLREPNSDKSGIREK
jgi:hypothetical protein